MRLEFRKTLGWDSIELVLVLTFSCVDFPDLGLSNNVFGSSVSTPGIWEVITVVPICISWVKVFHIPKGA